MAKIKAKVQSNGKAQSNGFVPRKTECPVSLEDFLHSAPVISSITVNLSNGDSLTFDNASSPRGFSTGSFGYFLNGKASLGVNGEAVKVQLSGNLIAVGSKEAPRS